jgi:hypothetical protein
MERSMSNGSIHVFGSLASTFGDRLQYVRIMRRQRTKREERPPADMRPINALLSKEHEGNRRSIPTDEGWDMSS